MKLASVSDAKGGADFEPVVEISRRDSWSNIPHTGLQPDDTRGAVLVPSPPPHPRHLPLHPLPPSELRTRSSSESTILTVLLLVERAVAAATAEGVALGVALTAARVSSLSMPISIPVAQTHKEGVPCSAKVKRPGQPVMGPSVSLCTPKRAHRGLVIYRPYPANVSDVLLVLVAIGADGLTIFAVS